METTKTSSVNQFGVPNEVIEQIKRNLKFKVILFVGPPLAGKGTQAGRLSEIFGIPAVSSGDLFRKEAASGSKLGQEMKKYMDKGELIPNDLTTDFLTQKLAEPAYQNGFIMDGYPRAASHVEIMDQIMADLDRAFLAVIHFDVDRSRLAERVEGRYNCGTCNGVFNATLLPNYDPKKPKDSQMP